MERWIIIEDHPNYEVSSCGRVRNRKTGRILKPLSNSGYERVNLDGRLYYVHKLVMEAFQGCSYDEIRVYHSDRDVQNNNISNLRIVSTGRKSNDDCSKASIVRCNECSRRYQYDICNDMDDDFFCGFGRK